MDKDKVDKDKVGKNRDKDQVNKRQKGQIFIRNNRQIHLNTHLNTTNKICLLIQKGQFSIWGVYLSECVSFLLALILWVSTNSMGPCKHLAYT